MNKNILKRLFTVFRAFNISHTLELLLGIKKMPADIYLRSEKVDLMGVEIPVVSPEDLIVLKLLAGGPVDLQSARDIYKILKERLDMFYLGKELKRCKLSIERIL